MTRARIFWGFLISLNLLLAGFFIWRLQTDNQQAFLPGKATHGHHQIELACEACHIPFEGVPQQACIDCHAKELEIANDSHAESVFTDPRSLAELELLNARLCVSCHVEHHPEMVTTMGVTVPDDHCFHCHFDIAEQRPTHTEMDFNTCAAAGCHNYHDNRALYEDFLLQHSDEPGLLATPLVAERDEPEAVGPLLSSREHDAPTDREVDPALLAEWAGTVHARAGVNCSNCHVGESPGARWSDSLTHEACESCHENEVSGFLAGKHGMRLASGLSPMSPSLARLPMDPEAAQRELGCTSCHGAHEFDTAQAAVDSCLGCHTDTHSNSYKDSLHFELWQAEASGLGAPGSGVSCATCHLPRETHKKSDDKRVLVQHNQNMNLQPNEKMIRGVCMKCHGLPFSIDALADPVLIERNFKGQPSRHVESVDMAVQRAVEDLRRKKK
ncbi:MAG: NrfA- nitrite reduction protein [Candidatus Dadabacteria bacterium]|nr:NrfA- nitrite reduction protein [Candidatus Dadabacteria bacterium]MDE0663831.1 NrfA- nitrite reduction protein [Candidatus Dadabacteria bacterium]